MKNDYAICEVSRQLAKVCERIESMSCSLDQLESSTGGVAETFVNLRMDELEHAQLLTLKLTELIAQESPDENADEGDGSAFAAGDLTDDGEDDDEESGGEDE